MGPAVRSGGQPRGRGDVVHLDDRQLRRHALLELTYRIPGAELHASEDGTPYLSLELASGSIHMTAEPLAPSLWGVVWCPHDPEDRMVEHSHLSLLAALAVIERHN